MSRAFTSEEYEAPQVTFEKHEEIVVEKDNDVVLHFCRGRDLNDPDLPYEIGLRFTDGSDGFFRSEEFAVKWFRKSVAMGSDKGMLALAKLYLADTKRYGYREAAVLLRDSSAKGNGNAATMLDMASITDQSTKKAFTTYRLNAELGSTEAMLRLAENFENGNYGKDKAKAAALWYTRAFRKGEKDAAKRVLNLYYKKKIELTEEELRFLRS